MIGWEFGEAEEDNENVDERRSHEGLDSKREGCFAFVLKMGEEVLWMEVRKGKQERVCRR